MEDSDDSILEIESDKFRQLSCLGLSIDSGEFSSLKILWRLFNPLFSSFVGVNSSVEALRFDGVKKDLMEGVILRPETPGVTGADRLGVLTDGVAGG